MFGTGDVARLLEVSPVTVRRWTDSGQLKGYRIGRRGERKYLPEDVFLLFMRRSRWMNIKS